MTISATLSCMMSVVLVGGAIMTWLLLLPVGSLLRRLDIVDRPNTRSSHTVPTIRGAGVCIIAVVAVGLLLLCWSSMDGRLVDGQVAPHTSLK